MAVDPKDIKGRIYEADLIDWRSFRIQTMQDHKRRLRVLDQLYRGDWSEIFPDESIMRENPFVMNLVQVGMDDIAKLVTEAVPSIRCAPSKDTTKAEGEATVREAIAATYWEMNEGEMLVPRLAMDLAGAGFCAAAAYVDKDADYPCLHRIDPRNAYPDVVNGKLLDMLVVEEINVRSAAKLFPDLGLDTDPTIVGEKVEIVHYYSAQECLQAIISNTHLKTQQAHITRRWNPNGVLPVAFAQLDSYDGAFRGMFDQVTGSLQTKNRIVKLILDYTDQQVYAPIVAAGLLNPEDPPGPGTLYRLDPNAVGAKMERLSPAGSSPQIFNILEYLDREQRGGTSYPSARQGDVTQSIASASFVASTQGQLTSTVKNIQRLIASLRVRLNTICFQLDEMFLDYSKPLVRPVGTKRMYTPSKDISGQYKNQVLYGAGSGLNRVDADVRVMQLVGGGIISKEEAREQVDFINDPASTAVKVEFEATQGAVLQKFLAEAPLELTMKALVLQSEGLTLAEAIQQISQEQAAQAAQTPPTGEAAPAGAAPAGPEGAPPNAALENQAMAAGGMPEGQGAQWQAPPQPLTNIVVK